MKLLPSCFNCGCKYGGRYARKGSDVGMICKQCKIKENNVNIGCGTGKIAESQMTCQKCHQYPSLNNKDEICLDCEKLILW